MLINSFWKPRHIYNGQVFAIRVVIESRIWCKEAKINKGSHFESVPNSRGGSQLDTEGMSTARIEIHK